VRRRAGRSGGGAQAGTRGGLLPSAAHQRWSGRAPPFRPSSTCRRWPGGGTLAGRPCTPGRPGCAPPGSRRSRGGGRWGGRRAPPAGAWCRRSCPAPRGSSPPRRSARRGGGGGVRGGTARRRLATGRRARGRTLSPRRGADSSVSSICAMLHCIERSMARNSAAIEPRDHELARCAAPNAISGVHTRCKSATCIVASVEAPQRRGGARPRAARRARTRR
jgi:hypothetical protein